MSMFKPSDIVGYKAQVQLDHAVGGYWDGGAKDHFEFEAEIERTKGVPAVRWGSWGANHWFVVNCTQKTVALHLAAVRRKLRGNPPRKITFTPPCKTS
jgi:hypothetical protein